MALSAEVQLPALWNVYLDNFPETATPLPKWGSRIERILANICDNLLIQGHLTYQYLRLAAPGIWEFIWTYTKDAIKALSYFGDFVSGG